MALAGVKIIDPADEPWQVVQQIASCSRIFSQSLHGLIVADALEVPSVWLEPSASMKGGSFKFEDYFTTMDAPKQPLKFTAETIASAGPSLFTVATYIHDRRILQDAFRAAASAFHARHMPA